MSTNTRQQISVNISHETHKALEELSVRTGLNRSRLYDMGLEKFVEWAAQVDDVSLRRLSAKMAARLGYSRVDSGLRRETSRPAPPMVNPYPTPLAASPMRRRIVEVKPRSV